MSKIKEVKAILKSIHNHPLAGKHWLKAYWKFLYWQLINRIDPGEKKVAFTNRTCLMAKKSMKGATGNIYLGLHEFSDMGFLLHFLRKEDMFFDIGANVGSYMVLASGHVGARTIAFEPIPSTFNTLRKNIQINKIDSLVKGLNVGVGSKSETLIFTESFDTVNHVVSESESISQENSIVIPVVAIDEIACKNKLPALIKIDVEGYEMEVLKGMKSTLGNGTLKAIIIELNGSGGRYGYDESLIHEMLLTAGFNAFEYDPFTKELKSIGAHGTFNTLYLRDIQFIKKRILKADKISLFSESF